MMQASPPTPPVPPIPPEPPRPPQPEIVTVGPNGITVTGGAGQLTTLPPPGLPRTAADMAALRARRSELSRQLTSASGRREELVGELEKASGPSRTGLEQRLKVLDDRIVQLERDIAQNGQLLASAPAGLLSVTESPRINIAPARFQRSMELTPIVIVFTLFVLAPIAMAFARAIWKRGNAPPRQPALSSEDSQRLARLEQAVEAIAIEVERVSEGQRFVTNLLAESRATPALASRAAETVEVGRR